MFSGIARLLVQLIKESNTHVSEQFVLKICFCPIDPKINESSTVFSSKN